MRPRSGFSARRAIAVNAGKITGAVSRRVGRRGGTSLPGVFANRLDPSLIRELSSQIGSGAIVVSGTNGKTTTARMLSTIAHYAGFKPIRNESGSNLLRGLATALLKQANILGNLPQENRSLGIFEADEAALPAVLAQVTPRTVVLLDLFRDQLDRYGEVATVARLWTEALRNLPEKVTLIANADDPLVTEVVDATGRVVLYFGVRPGDIGMSATGHGHDVKACPRCSGPITYASVSYGHLGDYECLQCGFVRPPVQVYAADIEPMDASGTRFILHTPAGHATVNLPLPGLYNVYNAVAAAAAAFASSISTAHLTIALEQVTPAFGRMESFTIDGKKVVLALAKNPTGLSEVFRTITESGRPLHLLVMLNDRAADGLDVSWIWDADIEQTTGLVESIVFGGVRAEDMALRFKYASGLHGQGSPRWELEHDTPKAFSRALSWTAVGESLHVVPTYTALLDLHTHLSRQGYVKPFWEA
jgi:lipid II isoglutaminyl synthase (glutamine-hydrolysing)